MTKTWYISRQQRQCIIISVMNSSIVVVLLKQNLLPTCCLHLKPPRLLNCSRLSFAHLTKPFSFSSSLTGLYSRCMLGWLFNVTSCPTLWMTHAKILKTSALSCWNESGKSRASLASKGKERNSHPVRLAMEPREISRSLVTLAPGAPLQSPFVQLQKQTWKSLVEELVLNLKMLAKPREDLQQRTKCCKECRSSREPVRRK